MRVVSVTTSKRRVGLVAGLAVVALAAAACGSSGSTAGSSSSSSAAASSAASSSESAASSAGSESSGAESSASSSAESSGGSSSATGGGSGDPKTATSAADFGGMDGLVAAAKKEGAINLIALPPDWANYGEVIKAFQAKYPDIKVNSTQPDISSAQEITIAKANKGTDKAPDAFDLGAAIALQNVAMFAPYKVASWADIPDDNKEPTGLWVNDYTGVMAVGYNADKFGDVTSLDQLTDAKFKGTVALNGNPVEANAALNGVMFASLANGGSLDDISKGVDYFKKLKDAGTLSSIDPTPATVISGQTGVVFDWSYNQIAAAQKMEEEGTTWKTFTPSGVALGSYYNQAINKDAAHPAAARLWEEFLYTPEAQNLWMKGAASPVLYQAMKKAGTVDAAAEANLPKIDTEVVQMTIAQVGKANDYLKTNWAKTIGN